MAGPREVPNGDGNISVAKGPQLHWFLLKPEKETTVYQHGKQMQESYQHIILFTCPQSKWKFTRLEVCSFRYAQLFVLIFGSLQTKWVAQVIPPRVTAHTWLFQLQSTNIAASNTTLIFFRLKPCLSVQGPTEKSIPPFLGGLTQLKHESILGGLMPLFLLFIMKILYVLVYYWNTIIFMLQDNEK